MNGEKIKKAKNCIIRTFALGGYFSSFKRNQIEIGVFLACVLFFI
jgi:hypothetical protein